MFSDNPPGVSEILRRSRVGIAGAGGLGSNLASHLARAGVGALTVVDRDVIELRNLNRQAYFLDQVGMAKVDALAANLARINPSLEYEGFRSTLSAENCCGFFEGCSLLAEALDLAGTKSMVLERWLACMPGVPVVGASGLAGAGATDSLRIFRSGRFVMCGDFCSDLSAGTLSSRVGVVAAMMANEAIRLLLEFEDGGGP